MRRSRCALAAAALLASAGLAAGQGRPGSPLIPGGDSHAPVSVNADRLEYFSKDHKAVYSGHVVAKQGDGSLRASTLTIFFVPSAGDATPGAAGAGSQVTRMEAAGPVTITQRDQVGVGASADYERASNTVTLSGDVSLTQGPDVVKGDRLVYNLTTGQAQVVGRVTSLFNPGGPAPSNASRSSGARRHGRSERGRAAASEAQRD